jgi:hypothetical protein
VRANQLNKQIKANPMPTPPQRRVVQKAAPAAAAAVTPEQKAKADGIDHQFDTLASEAQLGAVYDAIGRFDAKLTELPFELEKQRQRGYVHGGQLEDQLEALEEKWDQIRPRVETNLRTQIPRLDQELDQAEQLVNRMNPANDASVRTAESAVNNLSTRIRAAQDAVSNLYQPLESELSAIDWRITAVGQMMDLLDGSQEIVLLEAEGPLLAVEAEWKQSGDEGPDGYLFLTDQHLFFEQREEVVTKKRLGLFKADSEKIQKLLINVQAHEIEKVEHKEEGGFMGMGKKDMLELTFAATAPVSRARFHLKGQNSSDWAAMIKRVQTGAIDEDRSGDYVDELQAAEAATASFPVQCPNCFGAVQVQPRGATSYACEFCGAVIRPE